MENGSQSMGAIGESLYQAARYRMAVAGAEGCKTFRLLIQPDVLRG
ncbi:hypothetical protein HMPREF9371_2392 [Neisseria shayeganii 871]|uniref:Uncharacterized protein n=1 Tax=Neisseria shayeganii 871 TaxID=1032488 RepID=G4CLA1_9NEIS|nr:hypothetical protein HMPREF9371_2392 [Neisseria shayeganii 871]